MDSEITKADIGYISLLVVILILFTLIEPFQFSLLVGDSMEPTISDGSLIVYTQHAEIEENDIIVFTKEDTLIGHRVIDIDGGNYITKGDNNNNVDRGMVTPNEVEGKIIYYTKVPL